MVQGRAWVAGFILLHLLYLAGPRTSSAQDPTLIDVLRRVTDHVDTLHQQLFGVVMEEQYRQNAWEPRPGSFNGEYDRVTLRSDYLLVQPEGEDRFYGFRDVFDVNGRPVRDRERRLEELFLDPSSSARQQVRGIMRDSARYNIGQVVRNTNTPTLALLFLRADYKPRFEFERQGNDSPSLGVHEPDDRGDEDRVWVVAYREAWPTTIIGGRDGANVPAYGRFWLEPDTGRVLVTELRLDTNEMDSVITVRYEADDQMGHDVPVEMRERYRNHQAGSRVDGTATYSRFRRFRVQVEESAPPP